MKNQKYRIFLPVILALLLFLFVGGTLSPVKHSARIPLLTEAQLREQTSLQLPVKSNIAEFNRAQSTDPSNGFIENKGQWAPEVKYLVRQGGMSAWITSTGIVYDFFRIERTETEQPLGLLQHPDEKSMNPENTRIIGHVVNMKLENARESARYFAEDQSEAYYNYFIGNDQSKWASYVGLYGEVTAANVYSNIDARYYFDEEGMRYDFILNPGANVSNIKMNFEGAYGTEVNAAGELVIYISLGEVTQRKLYAYQEINGSKEQVTCAFTKTETGAITFTADWKDKTKPLVIDPLIYSTFLGSGGEDYGYSLALGTDGSAYVTGWTYSPDFPFTPGAYDVSFNGSNYNAFVTKFNPDGSTLVFSTFLGGSIYDCGNSIAVGADGSALVTGYAVSSDFPVTSGAFDMTFNGDVDVFITKLNPEGSALVYSTFLGGAGDDRGYSVALGSDGSAFVTGSTISSDFPVTGGAFNVTFNGFWKAFITKLNPDGSALAYSTFLGGSSDDYSNSIALGSDGSACVTGYTYSSDFPASTGAYDVTHNGNIDAFVTKLNPEGSALVYSTFMGGSSSEWGYSIAVDLNGSAYVTGNTSSSDFPATAGAFDVLYDGTPDNTSDVFIAKLNPTGSALVYSTFLGGSIDEYSSSIALGTDGSAYVTGYTYSSDFPATAGAYDETYYGDYDAFITRLNPSGSGLYYSSFLAGYAEDDGLAAAIGQDNTVFILGYTYSNDFPTSTGAFDETYNGYYDAFLMNLSDTNLNNPAPALSIDTLSAIAGDTVLVPVNIENFYNIGALTIQLAYDPAVMSFLGPVNWSPLIPDALAGGGSGIVSVAWAAEEGFSSAQEKLVDLKFVYNGGTSAITFNRGTTEIMGIDERIFNPTYTDGQIIQIYGYTISGTVKYRNSAFTPLPGASIDIMQSGTVIETEISDNTGTFAFPVVLPGTYPLTVRNTAPWGGVNATDALQIRRYVVGLQAFDSLQVKAADVNRSITVNATDALLIRRRVVGFDTTFVRGNWAFEAPTVTITNAAVIQNILGLCTGDVNASNTPGVLKANPTVNLLTQGIISAPEGKDVIIPVTISTRESIGAVTLMFEYSEETIDIKGVTSKMEGMLFSAKDGILTIAWDDIAGAAFTGNEPMFNIIASVKNGTSVDRKLKLIFELSEIADIEASVLQSVTISMPEIGLSLPTEFALSQNFPNPFNPSTTIQYDIPSNAHVRVEIFNTLGESVEVLMDAVQAPGRYTVEWNAKNFTSGVYFYRMTANSGADNIVFVKKLMIVK